MNDDALLETGLEIVEKIKLSVVSGSQPEVNQHITVKTHCLVPLMCLLDCVRRLPLIH